MKWMGRVVTLLVAGVLSAALAEAQYAPMTLKASVPFEFSVGKKSFPAGDYVIQRVGAHTLALRDAGGKSLSVVQTDPVQTLDPHRGASLQFGTVRGRRVLEQVWQNGMTVGYHLYVPRDRGSLVAKQLPAAEPTAEAHSPAGKR